MCYPIDIFQTYMLLYICNCNNCGAIFYLIELCFLLIVNNFVKSDFLAKQKFFLTCTELVVEEYKNYYLCPQQSPFCNFSSQNSLLVSRVPSIIFCGLCVMKVKSFMVISFVLVCSLVEFLGLFLFGNQQSLFLTSTFQFDRFF